MKIFLIGLPKSGRTTIAMSIAKEHGFSYVDSMKNIFRSIRDGEDLNLYKEEYEEHLVRQRLRYPHSVSDGVFMSQVRCENIVIDNILSPKDFSMLFDYESQDRRGDLVVFCNRTDNDADYEDHENIGLSVIRDYCFWLSSANLLAKSRWLEYNYKTNKDGPDFVRAMGAQNSVFIVKSIGTVISLLNKYIKDIV